MNSEPLNQKGEHAKGRTTLLGPETGLMTFERYVERSENDPRIPHNRVLVCSFHNMLQTAQSIWETQRKDNSTVHRDCGVCEAVR